jgi:hypothetical protein
VPNLSEESAPSSAVAFSRGHQGFIGPVKNDGK